MSEGYCCEQGESYCPSAGICSSDFDYDIVAYQLCPSDEEACVYPRTIVPLDSETMYHQYSRYFRAGDLCSYKITAPEGADANDILSFSLEFVENANVTLLKGSSLMNVFAAYEVGLGHSYTSTADFNLYLQFFATS